jgi:hypothetical protein
MGKEPTYVVHKKVLNGTSARAANVLITKKGISPINCNVNKYTATPCDAIFSLNRSNF